MKIYTKKGDRGETSLMGGDVVGKDHPRIEAYGSVDELNAILGIVQTQVSDGEMKKVLSEIQKQLFILGAELATPHPNEKMKQGFLQDAQVTQLESQMDSWERELKPLTSFILPGGGSAAAYLHLARTVCRRAERLLVHLHHQETLREIPLIYLNRLSDWFFVLARLLNHREGVEDVLWEGI